MISVQKEMFIVVQNKMMKKKTVDCFISRYTFKPINIQ